MQSFSSLSWLNFFSPRLLLQKLHSFLYKWINSGALSRGETFPRTRRLNGNSCVQSCQPLRVVDLIQRANCVWRSRWPSLTLLHYLLLWINGVALNRPSVAAQLTFTEWKWHPETFSRTLTPQSNEEDISNNTRSHTDIKTNTPAELRRVEPTTNCRICLNVAFSSMSYDISRFYCSSCFRILCKTQIFLCVTFFFSIAKAAL